MPFSPTRTPGRPRAAREASQYGETSALGPKPRRARYRFEANNAPSVRQDEDDPLSRAALSRRQAEAIFQGLIRFGQHCKLIEGVYKDKPWYKVRVVGARRQEGIGEKGTANHVYKATIDSNAYAGYVEEISASNSVSPAKRKVLSRRGVTARQLAKLEKAAKENDRVTIRKIVRHLNRSIFDNTRAAKLLNQTYELPSDWNNPGDTRRERYMKPIQEELLGAVARAEKSAHEALTDYHAAQQTYITEGLEDLTNRIMQVTKASLAGDPIPKIRKPAVPLTTDIASLESLHDYLLASLDGNRCPEESEYAGIYDQEEENRRPMTAKETADWRDHLLAPATPPQVRRRGLKRKFSDT